MGRRSVAAIVGLLLVPCGASAATRSAGVGQAVKLHGQLPGEVWKVKIVRVVKPLGGSGYSDTRAPSERWVGVVLRITNVGTTRISDHLFNDSRIVLTSHREFEPEYNDGWCNDTTFAISPGNWDRLCVAFLLRRGVGLRSFQFTPDSGYGDDTGVWRL